ncbi:MAG: alginate lyase family protein, partial [Phycisphaeraceae bacterium JB051]
TDHWAMGFVALPQDQRDNLAITRQRLSENHPSTRECTDTLRQRAQSLLDAPLLSVTDDDVVPPSGDRRDYTSMGPYWWPNPDTPDGLPYIRKDGQRNPESLEGDFPAMAQMTVQCSVLILAWRLTSDERFAQKAVTILRHFFFSTQTGMNPNLRYAQRIPGKCDGRGIGLIDTHRMVPLVELLPLLRESNVWTTQDEENSQAWFKAYLDWFEQSELGQTERNEHNNHGTWHDTQTVAFALYTDQPDRAKAVLEQVPTKRINQHISGNGSQPHEEARTLSYTYSMFNLEALFAMAICGQRVGINLWEHVGPQGQSLHAAIKYLGQYAGRFETWPHTQIKPISAWKLAELLSIAHRHTGDPALLSTLQTIVPKLTIDQRLFSLIYNY